ncbi:hypothetical protein MMC20_006327 [Loxospora ochrophaea]|nr:hypothetical protein [Loxospora ochrophaea]
MFGLGSNSTQTTLASVQTTSRRSSLTNFESGNREDDNWFPHLQNSPNHHDPQPLITEFEAPTIQNGLSTIAEANSQASRGVSLHSPVVSPEVEAIREESFSPTRFQSSSVGPPSRHSYPNFESQAYNPQVSEKLKRHQSLKAKAKGWMKSLRSLVAVRPNFHTAAVRRCPSTKIGREREESSHEPIAGAAREFESSTATGGTPSSLEPIRRDRTAPDEPTETPGIPELAKAERVRGIRHEKTRKREAFLQASCRCQQDCHCRLGSDAMNASSGGPERSDIDPILQSSVPEHALGRLITPQSPDSSSSGSQPQRPPSPLRQVALRHHGAQFDSERHSSSRQGSSSMENRRRSGISHSTWDSTTTAVDSTTGGLRGSNPRSPSRRSLSLPALEIHHQPEFRRFMEQFGPGAARALRQLDHFDTLLPPRTNSDSEPSNQDSRQSSNSAAAQTSLAESQVATDAPTEEPRPLTSRALSLANLPEPSGSQDGGERNENGPTALATRSEPSARIERGNLGLDGNADTRVQFVRNLEPEEFDGLLREIDEHSRNAS